MSLIRKLMSQMVSIESLFYLRAGDYHLYFLLAHFFGYINGIWIFTSQLLSLPDLFLHSMYTYVHFQNELLHLYTIYNNYLDLALCLWCWWPLISSVCHDLGYEVCRCSWLADVGLQEFEKDTWLVCGMSCTHGRLSPSWSVVSGIGCCRGLQVAWFLHLCGKFAFFWPRYL